MKPEAGGYMDDLYTIRPIAHIRSDYNEKFGIPRQSGLVPELEQVIEFEPQFSDPDAVRELDGFTYIWLIWGFSENAADMTADEVRWNPTVRPPRLGGGRRVGVWASRSPYRPNSLGLSSVRLLRIESGENGAEGLRLIVSGADLMDGTPIFDIKPYVPYSDSHPDASGGYSRGAKDACLRVDFPAELLEMIDESRRDGLIHVLSLDPRDAYEKKDGREYGISFGDHNVRFTVEGDLLRVTAVEEASAHKTVAP